MQEGRSLPRYTVREELAHAWTHGLGLALSVAGGVALIVMAGMYGDVRHVVSCAVFVTSLILLYAASTLYHGVGHGPAKHFFQKLDHTAIYVLIAGTYTPFTLVSLDGSLGWSLFAAVWLLAGLGIVLDLQAPKSAAYLSTALQLAMGWLVVVALEPLARALTPDGFTLLVAGGLAYTVGVVFYAWERMPFNHAVWHVFVLTGSVCHFSCVMGYVIPS